MLKRCPECKSNNIIKQEQNEIYCGDCGLVLKQDYNTVENSYGENYLTINDGLDLEMEMINIEKKHNYRSRSYERFVKFRQNYFDLFEDVLLENGYSISEVPHIFYNHFRVWYQSNSKRIGNKKRIDVINRFLMEWEV